MNNKKNTGIIEVNGYKLSYRIEGTGPTAIVIGRSAYYSKSFSQSLRNYFRLIFLDWRGFVQPPDSGDTLIDFNTLLDDIEVCYKTLALGEIIIIGHSAHALMALEYAKKYSNHVTHVVMIGISPNLSSSNAEAAENYWNESVWPDRKKALEERVSDLPDEVLAKLPADQRFVKWYVRRDPQAWYDYSFDSSHLWEGVFPNMTMFDFLYGVALRNIDITQGLESFDRPVFLALGRYDFIVAPSSSWDSSREKFRDITVRVFEHSGHSPQYEEPELFEEELITWLSRKSKRNNEKSAL